MRKVLSTTQFVLNQFDAPYDLTRIDKANTAERCNSYATLVQQPLTLSMFVPCVDGKPIEKPEKYDKWVDDGFPPVSAVGDLATYDQALKEQVLFEGWEYVGVAGIDTVQNNSSCLSILGPLNAILTTPLIPEQDIFNIEDLARQIDLIGNDNFWGKVGIDKNIKTVE